MCGSLDAPGSSICPCRQSVNTCTLFVILFILLLSFSFTCVIMLCLLAVHASFVDLHVAACFRLAYDFRRVVVVSAAGPRPTPSCMLLFQRISHLPTSYHPAPVAAVPACSLSARTVRCWRRPLLRRRRLAASTVAVVRGGRLASSRAGRRPSRTPDPQVSLRADSSQLIRV